MPSISLRKFERKLIPDVEKIIAAHGRLDHNPGVRGRRHLGYITRGGVLMLCAAWELYVEDILLESTVCLIENAKEPSDLPLQTQKTIAKSVKDSKHELKPLTLAGDGWREATLDFLRIELAGLNSPKSGNVDALFKKWIGLESCSNCWSVGKDRINEFVGTRGEIAHRGADADYVKINNLQSYLEQISLSAIETDNCVSDYLVGTNAGRPWRRRRV